MNPENTMEVPEVQDASATPEKETTPEVEKNRKPRAPTPRKLRKSQIVKLPPHDLIREKYQTALSRYQNASDPLNKEIWELVKTELESLYEFN